MDGLIRHRSFDAQAFVTFGLAFLHASARVRSPQVTRSVGVAPTLPSGVVGLYPLRISIHVGPVLRRRMRTTGWRTGDVAFTRAGVFAFISSTLLWTLFSWHHFLYMALSQPYTYFSHRLPVHPEIWHA